MDINRLKQRFELVGNSTFFTRSLQKALRVANTNISILVTGDQSGAMIEFDVTITYQS